MERLRLAIDATVVQEPMVGIQQAVAEEVKALADFLQEKKDWELIVFTRSSSFSSFLKERGVWVHEIAPFFRSRVFRILWQQSILPFWLRHYHCNLLLALAYTLPLMSSVPAIVQLHDLIALKHPELCPLRNRIHLKVVEPTSLRKAWKILVSTEHGKQECSHFYGDWALKKIHTSFLGIEEWWVKEPQVRAAMIDDYLHLIGEESYFLYAGAFEPKKGIRYLLEAYHLLAQEVAICPPLVLCGGGGWRSEEIERKIQPWKGAGRVIFLGYLPRPVLREIFARATLYIQPSLEEGFCLPILEALALGIPTITSDHPVLREVGQSFVTYVPKQDPVKLKQAIHRIWSLYSSPENRKLFAEQAQLYAQQWTWTRWAQSVNQLLEEFKKNY